MTEKIGFTRGKEEEGLKIEFIDIKRAFFHAIARREVYVELPAEDAQEGMCGLLKKSMYGTSDAAQGLEECYASAHTDIGFAHGKAPTCVFYHPERNIS